MSNFQILVVAPVGWTCETLADWSQYTIEFHHVEDFPPDGFSAWRTESYPNRETIAVASSCSTYSGGYTQHALNRFFSQALLRCKPKVVVIVGLTGCTADLSRVAKFLGIPAVLILDETAEALESLNEATATWLKASLASCRHVFWGQRPLHETWPVSWLAGHTVADIGELRVVIERLLTYSPPSASYDYSIYEFCQRDHPLLVNMQRGDTRHFAGCSRVLDLGCGVGIFLDCLRHEGVNAQGVERDPRVASYATGMGLNVAVADALDYLDQSDINFDGIYCSHFIEHLPMEAVQRVLQLTAKRMANEGVLVLVFPDPESIRAQLLGFWRDPEHVRFYHPELITLMAATVGLELEWSSYSEQPHRIVPFTDAPPPIPEHLPFPPMKIPESVEALGRVERVLQALGLVTERRLRRLEERFEEWGAALREASRQNIEVSRQLGKRTELLWDVNQTWCWNDNVTLKFRKSVE